MKHAIRIVGYLLTLLSLAFVFYQILIHRIWSSALPDETAFWSAVAIGIAVYPIAILLLALAWCRYVQLMEKREVAQRHCITLYGRTQLAKYLPGNIFHLFGRHLSGRQAGYSHHGLLGATSFEIAILIATATCLALAGLLLSQDNGAILQIFPYPYSLPLLAIGCLIAGLFTWHYLPRPKLTMPAIRTLAAGFGLTTGYFLITTLILWLMLPTAAQSITAIGYVLTCLTITWVAGFITPGAPAGMGVRDALMILLLSSLLGPQTSTLVTLFFRLVTLIGDMLLFFISIALGSRTSDVNPPVGNHTRE